MKSGLVTVMVAMLVTTMASAQPRSNPRLDSLMKETDTTALQAKLASLLSGNSENDANLVLQYYSRKNDAVNWEKTKEIVVRRFPLGFQAKQDATGKLYAEQDPAAKEQLYKDFESKFKEAPGGMLAFDVAASYAQQKKNVDKEKVLYYYNRIAAPGLTNNLKLIVIQNLLQSGETEMAARLTREGLDALRIEVANPPAAQQPAEQGRPVANPKMEYHAFQLMYAKVLSSQGNHKEALSYARDAYNADPKSGEAQTIYVTALIANNELKEAFPLLEKQYRKGNITKDLKQKFKDTYVAAKGSSNGYTELIGSIEKELRDSALVKIARLKGDQSEAPTFTLKNMDGKAVSLASLKGKVVIIDFWATWCGPCKKSFPAMQMAVDKYKNDKDVVFLFIDTWERIDKPLPAVKTFIKDNKYTFNVLMDLKDPATQKCDVIESYKVSGIPTKFVIDKNGKIAFRMTGFSGGDESSVAEISAMIESAKS
ncbi:MAG: hypothetical protein DI535_08040 [Citrobacter freundii]|nr:MAG: hypothetical protein DI535_08040 [Citrobacter freundii]